MASELLTVVGLTGRLWYRLSENDDFAVSAFPIHLLSPCIGRDSAILLPVTFGRVGALLILEKNPVANVQGTEWSGVGLQEFGRAGHPCS